MAPRALVTLVCALGLLNTACADQNNPRVPAASTFYSPETETRFSINIASDSADVYLRLSAPASGWVGVGFGARMEDSLMLLVYPSGNLSDITLSPRIGRRAGEPVFTPVVEVQILSGSGVSNGTMVLNARCRDCRVWPGGFLDATSRTQEMVYAVGPGLASDDPRAGLKRHTTHGAFTMDLVAATGTGGVPAGGENMGATARGEVRDVDRKGVVHAVLGCVVLFIVWPINVLLAGFLRTVRLHIGVSVVAVLCLGVVYGLGIATAGQYNRSKSFNSPHQILAFVAVAPLLLLCILPARRLADAHRIVPRLHAPLSSLALTLLLVSGGLGLQLSSQSRPIVLTYTALSLLLVITLAILGAIVRRRRATYKRTQRIPLSCSSSELGLLGKQERTGSATSVAGSATSLKEFLDESRRDGVGEGRPGKMFGGGTMPGPQYLLNMHPGVPVHIGSGRRI